MKWNLKTLQFLSQCFLHRLTPLHEPCCAAEKFLSEAAGRPNYGLAMLHLVAKPSVVDQSHHTAAVNFKNYLRFHWVPSNDPNASHSLTLILDPEKDRLKPSLCR